MTTVDMPLDKVPHDVLQHIAYSLATSPISDHEPQQHLLPLLLTCSKIHRALSLQVCPHLYASIFRATFDYDHDLHSKLTDSMLASELHHRYRILWRTRRLDVFDDPPMEELWSAGRLVLESRDRNEQLLLKSGFFTFIMTFVRYRLASTVDVSTSGLPNNHNKLPLLTLATWLLCLTATRRNIVDTPEFIRNELSKALRFPTTGMKPQALTPPNDMPDSNSLVYIPDATHVALLERAEPIIILLFALDQAEPFQIPPHLPQTRAIAIATQRSGPTMEDMQAIVKFKTPLFAETRFGSAARASACSTGRSRTSDLVDARACSALAAEELAYKSRLRPILLASYLGLENISGYTHVPGSLAGLWQGTFMVSGEPKPSDPSSLPFLGDFKLLQPMQCAITEYLCYSPHLPIPTDYPLDLLEIAIKSRKFGYEEYSADESSARGDPSEVLDVVIIGQTLHDHEQAWSGFKFAGRVRSDGLIVMLREPKNPADREGLGAWIFEGHIRYGLAFVGQWHSSSPTESRDLRGIFCLRKTDDDCIAWRE